MKQIDYEKVLADLRGRRGQLWAEMNQLDQVIAGLEAMNGVSASPPPRLPGGRGRKRRAAPVEAVPADAGESDEFVTVQRGDGSTYKRKKRRWKKKPAGQSPEPAAKHEEPVAEPLPAAPAPKRRGRRPKAQPEDKPRKKSRNPVLDKTVFAVPGQKLKCEMCFEDARALTRCDSCGKNGCVMNCMTDRAVCAECERGS